MWRRRWRLSYSRRCGSSGLNKWQCQSVELNGGKTYETFCNISDGLISGPGIGPGRADRRSTEKEEEKSAGHPSRDAGSKEGRDADQQPACQLADEQQSAGNQPLLQEQEGTVERRREHQLQPAKHPAHQEIQTDECCHQQQCAMEQNGVETLQTHRK